MKSQEHSAISKITLIVMVLLGLLLAVSSVNGRSMTAYAAEGDTVTRAEWLSDLAKTFEMTVEDDNYPDNYFSDLEESSEYYYDILLTVEFGVVEVEAGDPVYPDLPATREFAAHTLNYCLGFQLDEETQYTFSDAAAVQYPDDAQVAVNRGWLALIGGAFSPDTFITKPEAEAMLADAETVWHSTDLDESHVDTVELKDGIIDLIDETVYLLEDGSLYVVNGSGKLKTGDQVALAVNGMPCAFSVLTVEAYGNDVIITGDYIDNTDAYEALDVQGTLDGSAFIFDEDPEEAGIEYEEDSNSKRTAKKLRGSINVSKKWKYSKSFTIKLWDGASVGVKATLKNAKLNYAVRPLGESFVKINADMDLSLSCALDLAKMAEVNEYPLISPTVPGIGGFDLLLEFSLEGKCSLKSTSNITGGIAYSVLGGFRLIHGFTAKDFSCVIEAKASAGLKTRLGLTGKLLPFKGFFYAKGGIKGLYKEEMYNSGTPRRCVTFAGFIYASAGYEASFELGTVKEKKELEYTLYDEKNSPWRVYHHYEDGVEVKECTRGGGDFKYYTPTESKHWSDGWGGGSGSSGYSRSGEPVVIWTYTLDDTYNATITSYKGNARYLMIPQTIDGYTVTQIGSNVFKNNSMLV